MTTKDMMTLQALLEKSSDADLLREMIGFTAERLMALEVEELAGAAHGERSPDTAMAARLLHHGSGHDPVPSGRSNPFFTHSGLLQFEEICISIVASSKTVCPDGSPSEMYTSPGVAGTQDQS